MLLAPGPSRPPHSGAQSRTDCEDGDAVARFHELQAQGLDHAALAGARGTGDADAEGIEVPSGRPRDNHDPIVAGIEVNVGIHLVAEPSVVQDVVQEQLGLDLVLVLGGLDCAGGATYWGELQRPSSRPNGGASRMHTS